MNGIVPPLSLYAFVVLTGKALILTLLIVEFTIAEGV
jgi:hypothetical protein